MDIGDSRTYNYIKERLPQISIVRKGRTVTLSLEDKQIVIPPYPEIPSVSLIRDRNYIRPDVPESWVAQWKANGSNIRAYFIGDLPLLFTRGGFLVDWKVYKSFLSSSFAESLASMVNRYNVVAFGELVGRNSLVRICPDYWDDFLGGKMGYLVFDIFSLDKEMFLALDEVERLAKEYGLSLVPTEKSWSPSGLYRLLEEFYSICKGEVWEGFVFKDPSRGEYWSVAKKTMKWRIDETREFAVKIFVSQLDAKAKRIFEVARKFVFEGYLDPPVTLDSAPDVAFEVRNEILRVLSSGRNRNNVDRHVKKLLRRLLSMILSGDYRDSDKAIVKAIKAFRKIYVFSS